MKIDYSRVDRELLEDIFLFIFPSWMYNEGGCDCANPGTCDCVQFRIMDIYSQLNNHRQMPVESDLVKRIKALKSENI
jgi:hypothetical protein